MKVCVNLAAITFDTVLMCAAFMVIAVQLGGCTLFGRPALAYDVDISLFNESTLELLAFHVTTPICSALGFIPCALNGTCSCVLFGLELD